MGGQHCFACDEGNEAEVIDGLYLLTNSDLDTSLVELDGGGPGDEAGTEKKYLMDHDC